MVCTEKVGMLWKEMSAEKHEMEMEKAIIKQVCGHEKDPSQCTMLVKQYWPMVAKAMFSDMTAKMVCEGLSYCDMKRSGDDFDCDTCKSGVMAMGQLSLATMLLMKQLPCCKEKPSVKIQEWDLAEMISKCAKTTLPTIFQKS